jgi:hypothetical protein
MLPAMRSSNLQWQVCVCGNMCISNIESKENASHICAAEAANKREAKMAAVTSYHSLQWLHIFTDFPACASGFLMPKCGKIFV